MVQLTNNCRSDVKNNNSTCDEFGISLTTLFPHKRFGLEIRDFRLQMNRVIVFDIA